MSLLVSKDLNNSFKEYHHFLFKRVILDANNGTTRSFKSLVKAALSMADGFLKELKFIGRLERLQPKLTRDDIFDDKK